MSEREPYPAEEAAEDADPVVPASVPADVPEADAMEQAAPIDGRADEEPDTVGDRPEADAIEQRTEVSDQDEEYRG